MTNTITANNLKPSSMIFLSIQHVLVMYAGAVSIPLIVGGALGLSTAEIAFLITADLFVCGIATLIQTIGSTKSVYTAHWVMYRLLSLKQCTMIRLIR